jgi:FKBP-type peptidyl-prolyl cis-trans isomerase (trigger factor)
MCGQAVDEQSFLTQENLELILQEQAATPLPGFHEQVVGMSAGGQELCLQIPQGLSRRPHGEPGSTGSVHLHTAKQQDLPPLDDELAMMIGDYDTLEALRIGVRSGSKTTPPGCGSRVSGQGSMAFVPVHPNISTHPRLLTGK